MLGFGLRLRLGLVLVLGLVLGFGLRLRLGLGLVLGFGPKPNVVSDRLMLLPSVWRAPG